jgi:hypothetical protein
MRDKTFGESDLSPDEARKFIKDLTNAMAARAYEESVGWRHVEQFESEETSMMKDMYGKKWSLLVGIKQGMKYVEKGYEEQRINRPGRAEYGEDYEVVYRLDKWEEHYDEFGYGEYGRGLKIGKRLFFYDGSNFEFTEPDTSPDFTFSA